MNWSAWRQGCRSDMARMPERLPRVIYSTTFGETSHMASSAIMQLVTRPKTWQKRWHLAEDVLSISLLSFLYIYIYFGLRPIYHGNQCSKSLIIPVHFVAKKIFHALKSSLKSYRPTSGGLKTTRLQHWAGPPGLQSLRGFPDQVAERYRLVGCVNGMLLKFGKALEKLIKKTGISLVICNLNQVKYDWHGCVWEWGCTPGMAVLKGKITFLSKFFGLQGPKLAK